MAKKKGNRLKTLGKFLLIVITILAAIGLLFSFMAKLLPPSFSSTVAYCGLFFPYLLLVNFALTIIWLVVDFTWALLPALAFLWECDSPLWVMDVGIRVLRLFKTQSN